MEKFDLIKVDDTAEHFHQVTKSDIKKFINLTGDKNKIHHDSNYAKKTFLKKPVAHGMLSASFISTLIGTKLPGDGALWFSQNLEFLRPIRVGDKIKIIAKVKKKNISNQVVDLSIEILNQHKQKVITGSVGVKVTDNTIISKKDKKEFQSNLSVSNGKIKKSYKFIKLHLKRKVALVIGATGGIGQATCIQLAKDGYDIIVHYNKNKATAEKIQKKIKLIKRKSMIIRANITSKKSVEEMTKKLIKKFKTISVLVNCAALGVPNIKFDDLEWGNFEKHHNFNIKSNLYLIQSLIPYMYQQKYGKIVCISTQYTDEPKPELSYYISAKSALIGFVKSIATELAPKGISINIVSPGMTDTDLIADIPLKERMLTAAKTPMRRLTLPEDVAGAISFLASNKSDFITGTNIRVNGGQIMR
jgi:3-oxoacyl-[acyl-carrier protein] reductase